MGLIEAKAVDKLLYEELPMKYFYGRSLNTAVKNQAAIRERVAQIPTVDAVPVVRCKDCKYYQTDDVKCPCNIGLENSVPDAEYTWVSEPDWFCADGEEKDDDE